MPEQWAFLVESPTESVTGQTGSISQLEQSCDRDSNFPDFQMGVIFP